MANNILPTSQYLVNETFVRFYNALNFVKTANRNLETNFRNEKYATGQTINYRLEQRYLGGRGATASSEAVVQVIRPLTINTQFHTMVDFSGLQLTFDRIRDQPYLDMELKPRAKILANNVEGFVCSENLQPAVYQTVGTPGVAITQDTIFNCQAYMTELGIPNDGNRYCGVTPQASAALNSNLYNVFNGTINRGVLMDGFIGHMAGLDFFQTNFLNKQVAGVGQAGGTPPTGFKLAGTVTNGPITSGNQIALTGLVASSVVFNKGDKIQLDPAAGVFMVNPLNYNISTGSYQPLAQAAQFVVTQTATSDVSGNATITVSPSIVISGPRQNISAAIPNGAQLLLANTHYEAIAYQAQAIVFAAPPITELKGGVEVVTAYSDLYKMAITYTLGSDVRNYIQFDRLDIIAGVAINPEFAVTIMY